MVEDAGKELYPCCKYSKLHFIVRLLHIKFVGRWSKATVQTKNPRAIVGGTALGVQFCEVVVNHVFMRNAVLPRPYEGVTTILEACGRCIAWPHDRVMV